MSEIQNLDPVPYLPLIGWSEKEFKHKDAETVARAFMQCGFYYDTVLKDTEKALPLYYIGMTYAFKVLDWQPERWATLFVRVLIILRKNRQYEKEIALLTEVIPRYPYLAKYHKWQNRLEKAQKLAEKAKQSTTSKRSGIRGLLVNYPPTAKLMSGLSLPLCKGQTVR